MADTSWVAIPIPEKKDNDKPTTVGELTLQKLTIKGFI